MEGNRQKRNRRIVQSRQNVYYSDGNLAYQVQPAYYPEELPDVAANRPKKKKQVNYAKENEAYFFHRLKLFLSVGAVFSGCIVMMASYANVTKQKVVLNQMREELITMQNENNAVQADIVKQIDLKYIETEAKNRLGMAEPQPYQITYINVPKTNYTVQYAAAEEVVEKEGFSLEKIVDFLKKG